MYEKSPKEATREEALDYIEAMLGQLRKLAEREDRTMLAYLIGMAYLEASGSRGENWPSTRPEE